MQVLSIQGKVLDISWSFVEVQRYRGEISYLVRGEVGKDEYGNVVDILQRYDDVSLALDFSETMNLQIIAERKQKGEKIPFYG